MQLIGKPNRQQQRREASYKAMIDSAQRCFHDRGYAATTIQDIVEGTPHTHGAFYHHFKNKEDCFWQVIAYREQARGEWYKLPLVVDRASTSLEELLNQVFAGFSETLERRNLWVLTMVDFFAQHRDDPEARRRLAEIYNGWRREIRQFVSNLQTGGWIATDQDPDLLAAQIFAHGEGTDVHASVYSLDPTAAQAAKVNGLVKLLAPGARS